MKTLNNFINAHGLKLILVLAILIFFNTCGNPNKSVNKRLEALTYQVDSLEDVVVTYKDLQIEGLKAERRMIQSTDRKILDVRRQSEIDKEIIALEK